MITPQRILNLFIFAFAGFLIYEIEQVLRPFPGFSTSRSALASPAPGIGFKKTIALLITSNSPVIEILVNEFKKSMVRHRPQCTYNVITHCADGDPTLLKSMSKKVLSESYDLIWCAGTLACQTMAPLLSKHQPRTPVLFSSIDWTSLQELIEENPMLPCYATGWGGSADWDLRIRLMKLLLPHVKKVILVHQYPKLSAFQLDLTNTLTSYGIEISLVHAIDIPTTINYLRISLDSVDAIIVARESHLLSAMETFIALANNYQIPLYVSDLDSVAKGAACGTGSNENTFGRYTAWFAKKILFEGRSPTEMPFQEIKDWSVHAAVNKRTMQIQNSRTPENILFLMQEKHIIIPEKELREELYHG